MRHLFRGASITLLLTLYIVSTGGSVSHAQCATECGDANGNGAVTSADYVQMLNWIYGAVPPAGSLDCADIDGHEGVTIMDAIQLIDCIFRCGSPPSLYFSCPAEAGPLEPLPTTDYTIVYNNVFPATESTVVLQIALVYPDLPDGATLPLSIRVGGEIPLLGDVETGPGDVWDFHRGLTNVPGAPPGHLLLGYHQIFNRSASDRSIVMAKVPLSMAPATSDRGITLEWTELPPDNVPIVVEYAWTCCGFEPRLFGCPILTTGDANADGVVTVADVLYAVEYMFKGRLSPVPCAAVLDVDCNGLVTTGDTIYLVNYIFKGGTPPCNVCVLVGEGTWACP